jgi:hypothetical protein
MNEATKPPTVDESAPIPGYEAIKPEPPQSSRQPPPRPPDNEQVDLGAGTGDAPRVLTPEEEAAEDPLAHPLGKPIEAHGEQITILRWREPTGFDIEKAGNPIAVETSPGGDRLRVMFDEKKMAVMISTLASIPAHSVRSMAARDWNAVAFKIFRFFM